MDILMAMANLESIKRKIKKLSVDWWWFECGEASIVNVHILSYKKKKLEIFISPPLSLASAVNFLIKNIVMFVRPIFVSLI